MILVLYQNHTLCVALLCGSRTKPILTHNPEDPFLEIDVKGGEREITSKPNHFKRGRILQRGRVLNHIKEPLMLGIQEERSHMSLEGKDMLVCAMFLCDLIWFALIFFSLYSPIIQYKIQGEKDF